MSGVPVWGMGATAYVRYGDQHDAANKSRDTRRRPLWFGVSPLLSDRNCLTSSSRARLITLASYRCLLLPSRRCSIPTSQSSNKQPRPQPS